MFRNLSELYRFRALMIALTARHVRARYRGSVLGFLWSFLNPLCLIAVYTLVFRNYIRLETEEYYPLFLLTGLLPWIWFSGGVLEATSAISSGGNLITKAMFPPQVLPTVSVLTHFVNYLFALPILLLFLAFAGKSFGASLLFLPVLFSLQFLLMTGMALFLSALNVLFRDVQHILANLFSLLFFLTPVIYPLSTIPEKHRAILTVLNPLAMLMEMYRQVVLQDQIPPLHFVAWLYLLSILIFWVGNLVFNRYREIFAEYV